MKSPALKRLNLPPARLKKATCLRSWRSGHSRAGHEPASDAGVEIDVLDKNNRLAERNRARLLPASNWCSTWFPALVPVKPPADGNLNAPERQRSVRGY